MDGLGFVSLTETVKKSPDSTLPRQQNKLAFFDGTWRWSSPQADHEAGNWPGKMNGWNLQSSPIETEDKSSKPPCYFSRVYDLLLGNDWMQKNTFATKSWNRLPLNNTCGHGNWTKKAPCLSFVSLRFEVVVHPIQAFDVAFTVLACLPNRLIFFSFMTWDKHVDCQVLFRDDQDADVWMFFVSQLGGAFYDWFSFEVGDDTLF